ncbi:MAG: GTP-binding protein [Hyphomicrobiaceae bacterium]
MIQRKLMLLGEIGVGKTSTVRRLVFDRFETNYKATVGTDIYTVDMEPNADEAPFRFLVWDTDGNFGESIFRSVYVRQAHAALIIGDVTRMKSLESMVALAEGFADAMPGRYLSCVLNKVDLLEPDQPCELPKRLGALGLPTIETSAKTGQNVKTTFAEAAAAIIRRGL